MRAGRPLSCEHREGGQKPALHVVAEEDGQEVERELAGLEKRIAVVTLPAERPRGGEGARRHSADPVESGSTCETFVGWAIGSKNHCSRTA